MKKYKEAVKKIGRKILDIKQLGNHTVNHKSMPDLTEEEIKKEVMDLHQVIQEKFHYEMKYIRPPKGEYSQKSLQVTNQLGYKTVMWSFAYEDWNEDNQPDEAAAKKKILDNLHNRRNYVIAWKFKNQHYYIRYHY